MGNMDNVVPQSQRAEEEEGASPEQCALPAHIMHGQGVPLLPTNN